jgi:CubicO group peptidase (beta-lactamase class C family)
MLHAIAGIVALCALTAPAVSCQVDPGDEFAERVDALFAEWDRNDAPGAVVGVYRSGAIVHARGYGIANLDLGVALSPQTVLRIGSISKQFVAMCIVLLAEEGALELDDDVRTYLPQLPDHGAPITLRHMLHHTSGIREYLTLVELIGKPEGGGYAYTPRELVQMLARQEALNFAPGEEYSYSNSNYFLLSEVVARISGMKTSAFAKQRIFAPLGMANTRFSDDPSAIIPNRGWGYSKIEGGGYRMDILLSEVIGDLGVVTTVEDFFLWDQNLRSNRLGAGSRELLDTLLTRGRLNNGEPLDYALGISHGEYRGRRTLGHGGSAVGYVAQYLQFPDDDFAVTVFSNDSSFRTGRLARQVADIYLADQLGEAEAPRSWPDWPSSERPQPVALSPTELQAFAGDYYSSELHYVYALEVRADALELELRGRQHSLTPLGADAFRWGWRRLQFELADNGVATGFALSDGDVQGIRFRRVPDPLPTD